MLLINRTVFLFVAWNAFVFFRGLRNVFPFLFDVSYLCRSFMVESNTRNTINIGYDFHLMIVVHNEIWRTVFMNLWPHFYIGSTYGRKMEYITTLKDHKERSDFYSTSLHAKELLFNSVKGSALNSARRQVLERNFNSGWVRW